MTLLPDINFYDTAKTEGESNSGWFLKVRSVITELIGGAESFPIYTIAIGIIEPSVAIFDIATEGAASTDDLSQISITAGTEWSEGRVIILRANNDAQTVVLKHEDGGSGQMSFASGSDVVLDTNKKWVSLVLIGTTWTEQNIVLVDSSVTADKIADSAIVREGITGLILSNNVSDLDYDIDISIGAAFDSTKSTSINLLSSITKQIDAVWAEGTNLGGLFSGTVAIDTWYAVYIIEKDIDGTVDAGFDISPIAANIPVGYTKYRRIGWVLTDASSNIIAFRDFENSGGTVYREWYAFKSDSSGALGTLNRVLLTVTAPPNSAVSFSARITFAGVARAWYKSTSFSDSGLGTASHDARTDSGATFCLVSMKDVPVDENSQIAIKVSDVTVGPLILTHGYLDRRVV